MIDWGGGAAKNKLQCDIYAPMIVMKGGNGKAIIKRHARCKPGTKQIFFNPKNENKRLL